MLLCSGCVRHPRIQGRGTHVRAFAVSLLALTLVLGTAALAGAGTDPTAPRCDREGAEQQRCVGPVTDESGGGGDALTIAIGVVVGLAVAGVAFVLVRRQLASSGRS